MKCLGSENVGDVSKSYNGSGKRKSGCAKFLFKHQTIFLNTIKIITWLTIKIIENHFNQPVLIT